MDTVISVVTSWKDLISEVFRHYPLAAAIITLVAVGAFFYLEKEARPKQPATNILGVLLGWAVTVPILGALLWLLGQVWDVFKAIAPPVANILSSLFSIYKEHPLLVLPLILIAVVVYFAWTRWRPNVLPNRMLRVIVLTASVTVVAHLASPIADLLSPKQPTPTTPTSAVAPPSVPSAPALSLATPSQSSSTPASASSPSPSTASPASAPSAASPSTAEPAAAPPAIGEFPQ